MMLLSIWSIKPFISHRETVTVMLAVPADVRTACVNTSGYMCGFVVLDAMCSLAG
jgi:hypothetical protein